MAKHVKGDAIANASSYKLYLADGTELATQTTNVSTGIDFDLSTISQLKAAGTYELGVKAISGDTTKFLDSLMSNLVSYVVEAGPVAPGGVLLDEYTGRTLGGGSYGAGGITYGIQTNFPSGTYVSCIDFIATKSNKYANPTAPITTGKISIYDINSSGKIVSLLAEVESATSFVSEEELTNGIHVYRVNIDKTLTNPNIAVTFNPADTSSAPTAAYATGGSPELGKCYFGSVKVIGDTVSYSQGNYYLPFVIYN